MTVLSRRIFGVLSAATLVVSVTTAGAHDFAQREQGALFTMTNAAAGNAVLAFERNDDGSLSSTGTFATGGRGSGDGLGNQGAIALDDSGRVLYAVNAGSNDISVFAVRGSQLRLLQTISTGGARPVSLSVDDDLLYVLNAGSDSIAGFRIGNGGGLRHMANSARPLSGSGTGAAQISIAPDGRTVIVSEKATDKLTVYPLDQLGRPAPTPTVIASAGKTPFGFGFNGRRQLIVSEAFGGMPGKSAVSSYLVSRDGNLRLVSPSVANGQTAACWIVATPNRRYAYTTNTASGNISGYRVTVGGGLSRFDDGGVTADLGARSGPIDMVVSPDGDYLYALAGGGQSISVMRIERSGALTVLQGLGGLPAGLNGLAIR
jgi:6-phosphogluconolactonase